LPSRRVPPQFQQYQPITITIQNNSKTKFIRHIIPWDSVAPLL
jgi:hypothetical protein